MKALATTILILVASLCEAQQFSNLVDFEGFTGVELSIYYPDTAYTQAKVSGVTLSDTCSSCGFNFPFNLTPWGNWAVVVTRNGITKTHTFRVIDYVTDPH